MKIINASAHIEDKINGQEILKKIEKIGRVCYKSEKNINDESAEKFVSNIIKRGHESVLEHISVSARIICPRIISQMVERHRVASYSQESQRYCNYSNNKFGNELTFIKPSWFKSSIEELKEFEALMSCNMPPVGKDKKELYWLNCMMMIEECYFDLLQEGWEPQQARSVLPNSIKTEFVMTMNLREWRYFFKLRTDKACDPQLLEITIPLLQEFKEKIPVIFDDLN